MRGYTCRYTNGLFAWSLDVDEENNRYCFTSREWKPWRGSHIERNLQAWLAAENPQVVEDTYLMVQEGL